MNLLFRNVETEVDDLKKRMGMKILQWLSCYYISEHKQYRDFLKCASFRLSRVLYTYIILLHSPIQGIENFAPVRVLDDTNSTLIQFRFTYSLYRKWKYFICVGIIFMTECEFFSHIYKSSNNVIFSMRQIYIFVESTTEFHSTHVMKLMML